MPAPDGRRLYLTNRRKLLPKGKRKRLRSSSALKFWGRTTYVDETEISTGASGKLARGALAKRAQRPDQGQPDLSEDKVREVFWRAMDDAQLQTIVEKGMKDCFTR
jgi:hypothetical protein